jgi:hypothetical protein
MYEGVKGRKPTHKRVSKESDWKTYYGWYFFLFKVNIN